MIESPVLDEVKEILRKRYEEQYKTEGLAQGRAEGVAQGRAEGVAQGRVAEAQELVLEILVERFGTAPDDVRAKLSAVTDLPRLKALVRAAATCPDLAAFATNL